MFSQFHATPRGTERQRRREAGEGAMLDGASSSKLVKFYDCEILPLLVIDFYVKS